MSQQKYMQGHQHLDIKPWGQGMIVTVKQRSEAVLSYPQSSDQCIYNTRVRVVVEKQDNFPLIVTAVPLS